MYCLPVLLICLFENINNWTICQRRLHQTNFLESNLNGLEVLFYRFNHRWESVLEEEHHPFKVEFWTQNVKETILAITFVEL
jgi:hypothetical protein